MSGPVSFEGAAPPGTIDLSIGQPSADLLPIDLIEQASESFFDTAQPFELNYGVLQGDQRFLDSLAGFLTAGYGKSASGDELFVTGGSSQGLDLVSAVFARPGATVFVEDPSFFLAFQIFRDHGLNIVGIPMDEDGLCIDALQHELAAHTPAFLYTIPSHHNPGGHCTTEVRRRRIVELATEHDFLIIADEVYQLLGYTGTTPLAYATMLASGKVVSLGSFSKILAPGMRLGWIQTSSLLRRRLMAGGFINSGGSVNHISSLIIRQAIDNGSLDAHIRKLRNTYRGRVAAMDDALHEHFDGIAEWLRPDGGYFFWLRFDESIDTASLQKKAPELETGFEAGGAFSNKGQFRNFARLCFAHYDEDDIRDGIARMRTLF
jgi:DNA-binding transcriptional MocR family regulator